MSQLPITKTSLSSDRQLCDWLIAIKNLRPGSPLLEPQGGLAQCLFSELLSLPPSIDVLTWIAANKGDDVALLALARILDLAEQLHNIGNIPSDTLMPEQEDRVHQSLREKYGDIYDCWIQKEEDWNTDSQWFDTVDSQSEYGHLTNALTRLREKCRLPTEANPSRSRIDPGEETLLADLLSLPDSIDPVQWLWNHRLPLSARLVLRHLLQATFPITKLFQATARSSPIYSIRPKASTHSTSRLRLEVERIDVFRIGFAVHMKVRFRFPKGFPPLEPGDIARWEGFSTIRDEEGFHYVQMALAETSNQLWWWNEHLTLVCWPALENVHELILEALPAYLSLYRSPTKKNVLLPLPSVTLGEVRCRIIIPSISA